MTFNIAFILFPDFEELDFVGPYEVMAMAAKYIDTGLARLQRRRDADRARVPRHDRGRRLHVREAHRSPA